MHKMGSSQSTLRKFCTVFVWTIANISQKIASLVQCVNHTFSASPDDEDIKWKLGLHPFGDKEGNEDFLSLYLTLDKTYKLSVEANMKFTIMTMSLEESSFTKTTDTLKFELSSETDKIGISQFLERSKLLDKSNKLITANDEVNILCELKILSYENNPNASEIIRKSLSDKIVLDYSDLLADQSKTDVTLAAGGLEYNAHELILSARSSVFRAMFQHNMVEKSSRFIQIPDIDAETFKEMLIYIYCGNSDRIPELAPKLLKAADKYALSDLQHLCALSLTETLSVESAANTLILADLYGEQDLKEAAMLFIKANSLKVLRSAGWAELLAMPELMNEVCLLLANNKP